MLKLCLTLLAARLALAGILAGLGFGLAAGGALAAEPPTAIIIFDGSGSMWGRPDGETKSRLVLARDGVRQGLQRLAPTSRIGLMSFGHRRGGDCQDTEMIVAPEPLDVERVLGPLERLNPRGRGPLTKALREAASKLGPQSAPASVILIHDGPDNCQQDPCSAIGDLRAAHPQVRVHVVSLGLPPEEAQTVACLPQATRGKHYQVATAAEITAALTEALSLAGSAQPAATAAATKAPPATPPPAAAAPPAGRPGLQLWVTLAKGGPPLDIPVAWTVRKAGDGGPPLWEGRTSAPLMQLPSGRYEIEARLGLVAQRAVAEAVEGQPRSLGISLEAGTLALAAEGAQGSGLADAIVTLTRIEAKGPTEPRILRGLEPEFALPAGNYLVAVTSGGLRIERPVGIELGQRLSLAGSLGLGSLELTAIPAKDRAPLDGLVFAVFEDDPDAPLGRREVARSAAASPRFRLPAGNYYVIARRGAVETRDRVTVRAGETERRVMVMELGQLALSVRVAGGRLDGEGPITHRLERIDVQPPEVVNASGPAAALDIAAGQYRLETRVGLANVRTEREIRVKAGEAERVAIEHAAGAARFRLIEAGSAAPSPDASFEVRDRNGQVVWIGLGAEARALLLAGRYSVRAESRGGVAERAFDVTAGDDRVIDIAAR